MENSYITLDKAVIKFSGDSGDGMQLTGSQFSDTAALFGNDISTFPDYPAEIRAPEGTVGGVSGFQLHMGSDTIHTPGDYADVLVAMNPAAIKANRRWLKDGATIVYDIDSFTERNIIRAGYKQDPIAEDNLQDCRLIPVPVTTLTQEAVKMMGIDNKSINRCRNMFTLGVVYWLFSRSLEHSEEYINKKFGKIPAIAQANIAALRGGYHYAEMTQAQRQYLIQPAKIPTGKYRNINGNISTAWGFIAAAERSGLPLFCGSYPITPATEILQELSHHKELGIKAFQAEDEIAGICSAIGASFAGNLAVTTTSGPGLALKGEAIGLAVMTELPLVIVDVQRGGPSTGLPTKTEQSDLMQALYGRNGESPCVVIAASSPSDCFYYAYMASKIAVEHVTPVILLTDGYIANSSEPWLIPDVSRLPSIVPPFAQKSDGKFLPYLRDPQRLNRFWAIPGMAGMEHRVGGLEKMAVTGTVSYVPENHEKMVAEREAKVQKVAQFVPEQVIQGEQQGDLLVIGWGGTQGHLLSVVQPLHKQGKSIGLAHFHYINPLPRNTADVLSRFKKILVCEINNGQFASYLRMQFPQYTYFQYNKLQGLPFTVIELNEAITKLL